MLPLISHLIYLAERDICLGTKIPPILFHPPPLFEKGATNSSSPEPVNLHVQTECQNESWQGQNTMEGKHPDHRSH